MRRTLYTRHGIFTYEVTIQNNILVQIHRYCGDDNRTGRSINWDELSTETQNKILEKVIETDDEYS